VRLVLGGEVGAGVLVRRVLLVALVVRHVGLLVSSYGEVSDRVPREGRPKGGMRDAVGDGVEKRQCSMP
jgi:hypothetical protein